MATCGSLSRVCVLMSRPIKSGWPSVRANTLPMSLPPATRNCAAIGDLPLGLLADCLGPGFEIEDQPVKIGPVPQRCELDRALEVIGVLETGADRFAKQVHRLVAVTALLLPAL